MTFKQAQQIFNNWKEFIEINIKLQTIFGSIPESFLPNSPETLEEALNIVAKDYFDSGDKKMARNIQESIASLICYKDDKEALRDMHRKLEIILENPELEEGLLKTLKDTKDSWAEFKQ